MRECKPRAAEVFPPSAKARADDEFMSMSDASDSFDSFVSVASSELIYLLFKPIVRAKA